MSERRLHAGWLSRLSMSGAMAIAVALASPETLGQSGKTIYLAGPLGFSEAGTYFVDHVLSPELKSHGYQVINPFDLVDKDKVKALYAMPLGKERLKAWQEFNTETGQRNREAIDSCDIIVAVLDGPDVDSGTAAEIGYAFARNKRIVGYRNDFRLSSDDEGGKVNLQVEYFIRASGGDIVREVSELADALAKLPK